MKAVLLWQRRSRSTPPLLVFCSPAEAAAGEGDGPEDRGGRRQRRKWRGGAAPAALATDPGSKCDPLIFFYLHFGEGETNKKGKE